ncbi:MAG: hypothetical protein ACI3Y4_04460 [Candidatus Cryptobacteroides sp.]
MTEPATDYTAVYPYTEAATINKTGVISGITLPATQTAVEGSFDTKAALMAAKTVDGGRDLAFQNLVGYVKVATDFDCTKIELQAASGEALAGTGSITFDAESGEPSFAIAEETAVSSITLEGTITACKTYYIAVPAQTLAAGWCIRATSAADGIVSTKKGSKEIVFKKNTVLNLGILSQVEPRYVTFSAAETQKFKWDFQPNSEAKAFIPGEGEYFEYRVGDGKWTRFTSSISDIEFGGSGNDLQLRGISSQGTAADSTIYSKFNFTEFVDVYCSGDIRTLVNYKDAGNANTSNARFCYLYKSCFTLRSAPDLPATELASYCYHKLFSDCRKLKSAPVLPATRLAKACYSYMFEDANNISNTPELPALKAEESCYEGMFYDSNIYDAPALPATELAKNCYKKMFSCCSHITKGPAELPAKQLAESCYSYMFKNCLFMETGPAELPALKAEESCYEGMFYECNSLTAAPKLSATELAKSCYKDMFYACSSLSTAPALPATELAKNCYKNMFGYCNNLTTGPEELPALTLEESCYESMFYYCSKLGTSPEVKATKLATNCCKEMFYNCAITSGPNIPAKELVTGCFERMYYFCSNLSSVTINADKILDVATIKSSFSEWLNYAGTSVDSAYRQISCSLTFYNFCLDNGISGDVNTSGWSWNFWFSI